jgi:diguanylate cyclase (GGDEF)-like protein
MLALGAVLCICLPVMFAWQSDDAARDRDMRMVSHEIAHILESKPRQFITDAVWDDAVLNLDVRRNQDFLITNLATHFSESYGVDRALMIGRDGEPAFSAIAGEAVTTAENISMIASARGLVAKIRKLERERGPLKAALALGQTMKHPILGAEFIEIDGSPHLLCAILVQPDFGNSMPVDEFSAPIILTAVELDDAWLSEMASRLMLKDTHFENGAHDASAVSAMQPVRDASGRTIAMLHWTPDRPGTKLLIWSAPSTLLALFVLGLLSYNFMSRNHRTTERLIASEARATHMASHDVLTGLPNRYKLNERLEDALNRLRLEGRPFALHLIDLDQFKEINDGFGHSAGDDLIRVTAAALQLVCRESDMVARIGGDEFAIIQVDASEGSAESLASQIVQVMSAPKDISAGRMFVGCSVGITFVDEPLYDAAECMRRADLALYRAKSEGRGRYNLFEESMDEALRQRLRLRDQLRDALQNNELQVHYQPQFRHGTLFGMEALLRWNNPSRGLVSPGVFVPAAEETGLIEALGAFVMKRVMQDSHNMPGLVLAINVSVAQLRLRSFVPLVERLLQETCTDAHQFEIEITETLLLGDDPAIQQRLKKLSDMGFRIALDDFGTGYSSLSYLRKYPINKIKIDRSFVMNLGRDEDASSVVHAIVSLARALRLDVIAEGVETDVQRVRLLAAGCNAFQGYLFGRPKPLQETLATFMPGTASTAAVR